MENSQAFVSIEFHGHTKSKRPPINKIFTKADQNKEIKNLLGFVNECLLKGVVIPENLYITLKKSLFHKDFIPEEISASVEINNIKRTVAKLKINWI